MIPSKRTSRMEPPSTSRRSDTAMVLCKGASDRSMISIPFTFGPGVWQRWQVFAFGSGESVRRTPPPGGNVAMVRSPPSSRQVSSCRRSSESSSRRTNPGPGRLEIFATPCRSTIPTQETPGTCPTT
jgi:hypothetical protein